MADKPGKRTRAEREGSAPAAGDELPERWNIQRKTELVLRLLRGELIDAVSRESQIPAHELEAWKRNFLETDLLDRWRALVKVAEPDWIKDQGSDT